MQLPKRLDTVAATLATFDQHCWLYNTIGGPPTNCVVFCSVEFPVAAGGRNKILFTGCESRCCYCCKTLSTSWTQPAAALYPFSDIHHEWAVIRTVLGMLPTSGTLYNPTITGTLSTSCCCYCCTPCVSMILTVSSNQTALHPGTTPCHCLNQLALPDS
jgi:hypothetical protein